MTLTKILAANAAKAARKIELEYRYEASARGVEYEAFRVPSEASVFASIRGGDWWLEDTSENFIDRGGTIVQVRADRWANPTVLFVPQMWGPSAKHMAMLADLGRFTADQGFGDVPMEYGRTGHPLAQLAETRAAAQTDILPDRIRTSTNAGMPRLLTAIPTLWQPGDERWIPDPRIIIKP